MKPTLQDLILATYLENAGDVRAILSKAPQLASAAEDNVREKGSQWIYEHSVRMLMVKPQPIADLMKRPRCCHDNLLVQYLIN